MAGYDHPIRHVVRRQGRTLTWLSREIPLSYGYLLQVLLPPHHPRWVPAPTGFYPRVAQLLGVPERDVRPVGGGIVRHPHSPAGATHGSGTS